MSLFIAILVIIVDQITKIGYEGRLNSSVAFTNLDSTTTIWHTCGVTLAVGLTIIWLLRYGKPHWAVGLAIGGLVSNLIDRIIYNGVRDPIAYGPAWWNFADLAGLIGLIICIWIFSKKRKEEPTCLTDG